MCKAPPGASKIMARPERFELPTARFVAGYSIQLSYGRIVSFFAAKSRSYVHYDLAEREGLIRSFHSLTLWAHFVRPNRLRRSVEPYCLFRGLEFNLSTIIFGPSSRAQILLWRRERDSNPRRGISPYSLSRGALSTTQPSLRKYVSKVALSFDQLWH